MAPLLRPAFCTTFVYECLYIHLLPTRTNRDQRSWYQHLRDVCKRRSPGVLRSFWIDNRKGYNDPGRRLGRLLSP